MKVSLQTPIQEQIFLAKKIQMDPRFFGENLLIETNNKIGELWVLGLIRALCLNGRLTINKSMLKSKRFSNIQKYKCHFFSWC